MNNIFYLFLIVSSLSVTSLNAQYVAMIGGLNLTNVYSEDLDESLYKRRNAPGFHFGLVFDVPVKNGFSIEMGMQVNSKGY